MPDTTPVSHRRTASPFSSVLHVDSVHCFESDSTSLTPLEAREAEIRRVVKKWFGPFTQTDSNGRAQERGRYNTVLMALLRLHRIGHDLTPGSHPKVRLPETDVTTAIVVLNRLAIIMNRPLGVIVEFCHARAIRENNPARNLLDPMQLRHLLTFHQDIPHEELNATDIKELRGACKKNNRPAILGWFGTMAERKHTLPPDTAQFLRQIAIDLWDAGHHAFLETYATRLAVFDSEMNDVLGWENTRLFFSILKRLQGKDCASTTLFLDADDIATAAELHRALGDGAQTLHFQELAAAHQPASLQRLEHTVLAASRWAGAHGRPAGATAAKRAAQREAAEAELNEAAALAVLQPE